MIKLEAVVWVSLKHMYIKDMVGGSNNQFFLCNSGDPYKLARTFCGREKSPVDVVTLEACLKAFQITYSCSC